MVFRLTKKTMKEIGVFAGLIVAMHVTYYTIQSNPSMVSPHARQELFYIRWLKEKFPALQQYGVQEEEKKPEKEH